MIILNVLSSILRKHLQYNHNKHIVEETKKIDTFEAFNKMYKCAPQTNSYPLSKIYLSSSSISHLLTAYIIRINIEHNHSLLATELLN